MLGRSQVILIPLLSSVVRNINAIAALYLQHPRTSSRKMPHLKRCMQNKFKIPSLPFIS